MILNWLLIENKMSPNFRGLKHVQNSYVNDQDYHGVTSRDKDEGVKKGKRPEQLSFLYCCGVFL